MLKKNRLLKKRYLKKRYLKNVDAFCGELCCSIELQLITAWIIYFVAIIDIKIKNKQWTFANSTGTCSVYYEA